MFGLIYFIRKKRNVVMHSRFDVCVLIVLSELICYCEQSCFVLLNVFRIIFFRKARCCFATMFVLVSFSSFCFFWKEVFVIGISRASVWLFGFEVVYFFSEGGVLFCDVFLLLLFSSFCFCWEGWKAYLLLE